MIIGHRRQFDYLKKVHERGTFAHAYLFFGPENVGKLHVAQEWIKLFFKEDVFLSLDEFRHPDVTYLSRNKPLVSDNKKEIGVDDVLEIRRRVALRAHSGGHKFIIIDGADDLSEEAQASLLKILEEPPAKTIFVLISGSAQNLLPTIVSRTVAMEFALVPEEEIAAFLDSQKVSDETKKNILSVFAGRPGIVCKALLDGRFLEEETDRARQMIKIIESETINQFFYFQKIYQDQKAVEENIRLWLWYFRKKLLASADAVNMVYPLKQALRGIDLMKQTNVNKRLLLENIFLNFN